MDKKIFIIVTISLLIACNNENSQNLIKTENNEGIMGNVNASDQSQINKNSFEEISAIPNQMNVEEFNIKIVQDDDAKRILFFVDEEGKKKYKTIFIKKQRLFKLIQLDNNDLIFKRVI
ncbi:hypothetical protein [Bacillus sp. es.036]|uniref:hypothetical protein n=1 Tax=Bacillus sp. es.036 TaxID=1761764 RepID=UPI000BF7FED0|nr:hypothetical protein [Bacillus sp. es.036]PFG14432.1 hypothetical protein ATG70_2664 [Bacillus sp. es.036]